MLVLVSMYSYLYKSINGTYVDTPLPFLLRNKTIRISKSIMVTITTIPPPTPPAIAPMNAALTPWEQKLKIQNSIVVYCHILCSSQTFLIVEL